MPKLSKSLVLLAAATHIAAAPLTFSTPAYALKGDVTLPEPYVSRAFDAVLLPIDSTVRTVFALNAADQGVLVLAVQPGGVADSQGIEPGDVLYEIRGHKVVNPIELDEIAYYWITQGVFDFGFDYYRAGVLTIASAVITLELYEEVVDITTVSSWESWTVETSFSYEEFYAEYSEELTESYESSEIAVEETVTSEEFAEEVTEEATEETEDVSEEDVTVEDDSVDEGVDDADDSAEDSDDVSNDGAEDDAPEDDQTEDDSGDDSADDEGADDGGDEGGDEE
jgi:hypothetical protein